MKYHNLVIMIKHFLSLNICLLFLISAAYTSKNDDNIHVVCKPSEDGLPVYVPHPYECNKYFECVGIDGVLMTCPENLVFDPVSNVCNWPWAVDCEDKPYPGEKCCEVAKVILRHFKQLL